MTIKKNGGGAVGGAVRRAERGGVCRVARAGRGAVGIRMTTDGVVVAGVSEVQTPNGKRSPAAEAGLKKGDVITRLGGADIGTAQDFKTALAQLDGSKTTVTIERGGKAKQLNITPAQDADGAWKLGLWLRDGVSGVGTLTFYDPRPAFTARSATASATRLPAKRCRSATAASTRRR